MATRAASVCLRKLLLDSSSCSSSEDVEPSRKMDYILSKNSSQESNDRSQDEVDEGEEDMLALADDTVTVGDRKLESHDHES